MANIIALSEAASIGHHSMIVIARSDETLNVGQIADQIHSSSHHVAKVHQRLGKSDYVSYSSGPSGGFTLKADPEKNTLIDFLEANEGKFADQRCPADKDSCPFDKKCLLG